MSVAQNSALVRFFAALWAVLSDGWADSVPGKILRRIEIAVRHGVEGSVLCASSSGGTAASPAAGRRA